MQISRLLETTYILINKKRITAGELAQHFEVSKRTILRDVEALSGAGIPIYTERGKGGGIFLMDNYTINNADFSKEEQEQIVLALKSYTHKENETARVALTKLEALFQATGTSWIEVDFSGWGMRKDEETKFELLKSAILAKQAIEFVYASGKGEIKNREVLPLKLLFKATSWYLQGYCLQKKSYRTFKINRINNAHLLHQYFATENFTPPPIEVPFEHTAGSLVEVTLKIDATYAYRVYDEFTNDYITKNKDGSYTVKTTLPEDNWLYGYILSFLGGAQVVAPKRVRDRVVEICLEMAGVSG